MMSRMQEYYGDSAKIYGQTRGKRLLLMPALGRLLPKAERKGARLLDVACGNGDMYDLAVSRGYRYFGIDVSEDLLARARADHPGGEYVRGDARRMSRHYKTRFDTIIVSMLFPSLSHLKDTTSVLKECRKLVRKDSVILVGVTHPSFDHYMQSFLFQRSDVHTDFKGYFDSGSPFQMNQMIQGQPFPFEDYHWTLADYTRAIHTAGLRIETVDECRGDSKTLSESDKVWTQKRDRFPTYMVLALKIA